MATRFRALLERTKDLSRPIWADKSALSLLLANAITIVIAVCEGWRVVDVMWVYCVQSAAIGFYSWRGLRRLVERSKRIDPGSVDTSDCHPASFFAIHYGTFQLVFSLYVIGSMRQAAGGIHWLSVLVCIGMFLANHAFSHRYHQQDITGDPVRVFRRLFAVPYLRVVPMNAAIFIAHITGVQNTAILVLFLLLKTFTDLIAHLAKHRWLAD